MSKLLTALIFTLAASQVAASNQDNINDLDDGVTYLVSNGKAYKVINGLVSNEWQPLAADGYEYSEQYLIVKAANESLRKIKSTQN